MSKLNDWWEKEGLNLPHKEACVTAYALGVSDSIGRNAAQFLEFKTLSSDIIYVNAAHISKIINSEGSVLSNFSLVLLSGEKISIMESKKDLLAKFK